MKNLFEIAVSFWDATEFPVVNWIILGLIAPLAFVVAFKVTGEFASELGYNSKVMSVFHWIIRLIAFVGMTYLIKGLIWFVAQPVTLFNVTTPRFIASIIVAILILVIAIVVKSKSNIRHKLFWK